jgi:hypothetical protein
MTDEISDDELERQMRRKLLLNGVSTRSAGQGLSADDQRIAAKLLGRDNAERLAARKSAKPFRPSAVIIHYEVYWVHETSHTLGRWCINRVENGRPEPHYWPSYSGDVQAEVAALRRKGFTVKQLKIEGAPPLFDKPAEKSHRKTFGERFGGFRS